MLWFGNLENYNNGRCVLIWEIQATAALYQAHLSRYLVRTALCNSEFGNVSKPVATHNEICNYSIQLIP